MAYSSFLEHIRATAGTRNWCVARRTRRIVDKYGSDVVCFSPTQYDRMRLTWINAHPAMLLAQSLPESDEKRLICKTVQKELS